MSGAVATTLSTAQSRVLVEVNNEEIVTTIDTQQVQAMDVEDTTESEQEKDHGIPDINIPQQSQPESCSRSNCIDSSGHGISGAGIVDNPSNQITLNDNSSELATLNDNPSRTIDNPSSTTVIEGSLRASSQAEPCTTEATDSTLRNIPSKEIIVEKSSTGIEEKLLPSEENSNCSLISSDVCIPQQTSTNPKVAQDIVVESCDTQLPSASIELDGGQLADHKEMASKSVEHHHEQDGDEAGLQEDMQVVETTVGESSSGDSMDIEETTAGIEGGKEVRAEQTNIAMELQAEEVMNAVPEESVMPKIVEVTSLPEANSEKVMPGAPVQLNVSNNVVREHARVLATPLAMLVSQQPMPVCLQEEMMEEEEEEEEEVANENNVISIPDDGQSSDLETLCSEVVGGAPGEEDGLLAAVKAEDDSGDPEQHQETVLNRLREQIAAATIPLSIANALPFALISSSLTTTADSLVMSEGGGSLMALPTSGGLVPIRINSSAMLKTDIQHQQQYFLDTASGTVTAIPRFSTAAAPQRSVFTTTAVTTTTAATTTSSLMTRILPSLASRPAPRTDILLQTAREVLQLTDDPPDYRRVFTGGGMEGCTLMIEGGEANILSSSADDHQDLSITDEVSHMEVTDESGTYIIEPVTGEEYYSEDPNIMWIQETVEVEQESYDNLPNMVIILNPNGTVNEELMLANGMTIETIRAVTDAATGGLNLQTVMPVSQLQQHQQPSNNLPISIASLQHPIPKKLLTGVQPLSAQAPRTIIESAVPIGTVKSENVRSVILHPKDDVLVLDDLKDPMLESMRQHQLTSQIININGTQHIITSSKPLPDLKRLHNPHESVNGVHMTPLGTLDLSLPKKPDPSLLEQYVDPNALVSENTVLKVLDDSDFLKRKAQLNKNRRQKARDENGNGFVVRKTTSLGALGQALHGIPRDSRENAVQICPICKFQATTKNPYRHLQDHLARVHFKDRIAAELPTKKPYICPFEGCDGKQYPDWQAVMRHYIGKKHGILDKYVKEELNLIRRENGGRIPGALSRPGIELML